MGIILLPPGRAPSTLGAPLHNFSSSPTQGVLCPPGHCRQAASLTKNPVAIRTTTPLIYSLSGVLLEVYRLPPRTLSPKASTTPVKAISRDGVSACSNLGTLKPSELLRTFPPGTLSLSVTF